MDNWFTPDVCQELKVTHCVLPASTAECSKCEKDHYLSADKKCFPFPPPSIIGCVVYASADKCLQCQQGMYLAGQATCKLVAAIANCVAHDGAASSSVCQECGKRYYLNGGLCQERAQSSAIA